MRTSSRPVGVLLFDEVGVLDVTGPLAVLTEAGRQYNWRAFKILTAAHKSGPIVTRNQIRIEAAHELSTCPATEILLVPGGYGARRASEDGTTIEWVAERARSAEIIAAVGLGSLVLARAGLLDGVDVAVSAEHRELFTAVAPDARLSTDRAVVRSSKILTARTAFASLDLALDVVASTLGDKQAASVAQRLGYAWQRIPDVPEIR